MVCHFHNHLQDLQLDTQSMVPNPNCQGGSPGAFRKHSCLPPPYPRLLFTPIHRGHQRLLVKPVPLMGTQAEMLQEETELRESKAGPPYTLCRQEGMYRCLITPSCRVSETSVGL